MGLEEVAEFSHKETLKPYEGNWTLCSGSQETGRVFRMTSAMFASR